MLPRVRRCTDGWVSRFRKALPPGVPVLLCYDKGVIEGNPEVSVGLSSPRPAYA
jgi:uncharacterized protein YbbK (DUF523 family)